MASIDKERSEFTRSARPGKIGKVVLVRNSATASMQRSVRMRVQAALQRSTGTF